LGRKLVDELGLEPSVDTLGRWMAHYIADLIVNAENTTGEEKNIAEKKCFDAILELWKHRTELPDGKRPFEELEPVIRTIESLDPCDDTPRYFRSARLPQGKGEEKSEADRWIDIIVGLDYSAKILIGYCLAEAARAAIDKSEEWVKLAESAETEDSAPELVVRFLSRNANLGSEPDPNAKVRQQLHDRIRRLEGFIKLAEVVAVDLTTRLQALPPLQEGDNSISE